MCVTGPSGCGKTECIRTLGAAHREMGHLVKTDIICTQAVESEELLGYVDPEARFVFQRSTLNSSFSFRKGAIMSITTPS